MFLSVVLTLLSITIPALARDHRSSTNHRELARSQHREVSFNATQSDIEKRGGSSFTWYPVGLGACGGTNTPDQFVVAINVAQYAGGSHCYDMITIEYNGRTAQAQIVDECMNCPMDALDFSKSLFTYFVEPRTAEDVGQIYGSWSFGSGGGGGTDTTTQAKPKPTTTSKAPATTTTSSSVKPKPTTTSSSSSYSTSSTISSSSPVATSSSSSAAPAEPTGVNNLSQFGMALLHLAGVAVSAAETE